MTVKVAEGLMSMKRPRMVMGVLVCSLFVNAWFAYREYRGEAENRQALSYPAERVAYRLAQLAPYAETKSEADWADVGTRTWLYDSITEIIDYGYAAEQIRTVGQPAEVAHEIGELSRRLEAYRDDVHRLAFETASDPSADRAKVQELARQIRDAGWGSPGGSSGWTTGRDWSELQRPLAQLLAAKW